jgi:hypothetical protein
VAERAPHASDSDRSVSNEEASARPAIITPMSTIISIAALAVALLSVVYQNRGLYHKEKEIRELAAEAERRDEEIAFLRAENQRRDEEIAAIRADAKDRRVARERSLSAELHVERGGISSSSSGIEYEFQLTNLGAHAATSVIVCLQNPERTAIIGRARVAGVLHPRETKAVTVRMPSPEPDARGVYPVRVTWKDGRGIDEKAVPLAVPIRP